MKLLSKFHNLSLHMLTLCGLGALVCLAVNLITAIAIAMFVTDHCEKTK